MADPVITESRGWGARLRLAMLITGSLLAFMAPSALASVSHTFSTTISGAGVNALSSPTDVEIDQTSHDIYVTDPGNHRVEKFDALGNFLLMFGKGVNSGTGSPNVCTNAGPPTDVCQAGTSASSPGAFQTPSYLAVDNSSSTSKGDIYVGDPGTNRVQKFDSSGHIVSTWGPGGQKDGSDATDLGNLFSSFGSIFGVAVGGPNGDLYVGGNSEYHIIWVYTPDGTYKPPYQQVCGVPWLKADPAGNLYFTSSGFFYCGFSADTVGVGILQPTGERHGYQMGTDTPVAGFGLDPSSGELYQDTGSVVDHYGPDCNPPTGPCDPVDSFGSGHLFGPSGVAVDGASHTVYVANSTSNDVAVFGDVRPIVTTDPPSDVTESSVTLNAHIDPAGRGDITECRFEYGFDKTYGTILSCSPDPASSPPGSNFSGPTAVKASIANLSASTSDHYRVVVSNAAGATKAGADETFITTAPPAITGLVSANVTATSADLKAQVNSNGLETRYRFEYGPTLEYGHLTPVPDGVIAAANSDQAIEVHLANLVPHVGYHYRLVAENDDGATETEDHTFTFFPPSCPNQNVRQQTQANFLPDCRAYELVSPGDAGGTQLYAGGPNTGHATNPSRLSFTGLFSAIPNSGGSPLDGNGDLYVATRTDTGWVTRYVGLPSSQSAVDGGPPQGPPGSAPPPNATRVSSVQANGFTFADKIQNGVLTDPGMDRFLVFNAGSQEPFENAVPKASNAPYVYGADGQLRDRWPTNLAAVPAGAHTHFDDLGNSTPVQPGGTHALDCPPVQGVGYIYSNYCPGDVTASADLIHFVFASEWNVFAPGGQLSAPGSVYDNDTVSGTVAVASKTPAGDDIPHELGDQAGDPLQIPTVSEDGSHILMAAGATGPCGYLHCKEPPCQQPPPYARRCPMQPSHLYMRVNGAVTYDVSQGHAVDYVGATPDGSKVYFTSGQRLTPDDTDSGTDLYMWGETTNSLTLISKGSNGAGNSDSCHASFTAGCGVNTYSSNSYCQLPSGLGSNCLSDDSIAADNGDIYFFSPEQLDGTRGITDQENMYVYRNDHVQYVTTLLGGPLCFQYNYKYCTQTSVVRMQVTPDDGHMAFVTDSPVTQYDNAGHLEMYVYDPASRRIICASCIPSGEPPTTDVYASQDGLFMTDDGRVFFSTEDGLVHGDTNKAQDVYEYVEGRPQLITLGTGDTRRAGAGVIQNSPGLVGVSADGQDVYFSAYDTLVREDHNGLFLKFYDARSGGGFSAPAPPPPCEAADECHAPASQPPVALQEGTGSKLSGGTVVTPPHHKGHRHRKAHHKRRPHSGARAEHHSKGGPR